MAKTEAQRLALAKAIDTALGTQVADTPGESTYDAVIDWLTAIILEPASPASLAAMQAKITALETRLTLLEAAVKTTVAVG